MEFCIGISLERLGFRVSVLKKEKKSISVESLHFFLYGPENVKLFYNLSPFHTGKEMVIASGMPSTDIIVRKLHIPLKERRKILKTLPFQFESLIPLSSQDPLVCVLFKLLSKQMTSVTALGTTKELLSAHIHKLDQLEIYPDTISCVQMALVRFVKQLFSDEDRVIIFDAREENITCLVYEEGEIAIAQTLNYHNPLDLEKLAIFLKKKGAIDDTTPWLLTGEMEIEDLIKNFFLGKRLELDADSALFAVSMGFALDALARDSSSVQFCQNEFVSPPVLRKRKKRLLSYTLFCAGSCLAMMIGSFFFLHKKQDSVEKKLQAYLPPSLAKNSFDSIEEMQERVISWEKSLRGKQSSFPLIPTVPKVSDVLAWLSTHPALSTKEGEQKPDIEVTSLHYNLIRYPKVGIDSSPYRAQVSIELIAKVPRLARDFHEALLKKDPIMTGIKEVKWQTQNQTHFVSFELCARGTK